MKEIEINYEEMKWREHKAAGNGLKSKLLRAEDGVKTVLFKMPIGFEMKAHTHIKTEQHFILQGKYEIDGKLYTQDTFRFIPAGTIHGPLFSKNGAIILVIRYS